MEPMAKRLSKILRTNRNRKVSCTGLCIAYTRVWLGSSRHFAFSSILSKPIDSRFNDSFIYYHQSLNISSSGKMWFSEMPRCAFAYIKSMITEQWTSKTVFAIPVETSYTKHVCHSVDVILKRFFCSWSCFSDVFFCIYSYKTGNRVKLQKCRRVGLTHEMTCPILNKNNFPLRFIWQFIHSHRLKCDSYEYLKEDGGIWMSFPSIYF